MGDAIREVHLYTICARQTWNRPITSLSIKSVSQASFKSLTNYLNLFLEGSLEGPVELSVKYWYLVCFPLLSPPHPLLYCVFNHFIPNFEQTNCFNTCFEDLTDNSSIFEKYAELTTPTRKRELYLITFHLFFKVSDCFPGCIQVALRMLLVGVGEQDWCIAITSNKYLICWIVS
jgi:hypothetical protein